MSGRIRRGITPRHGCGIAEKAFWSPRKLHHKSSLKSSRISRSRGNKGRASGPLVCGAKGSVSEETDTEPPEMRKLSRTETSPAAKAFSKAEQAVNTLFSRHGGSTKVRHRDRALRALNLAGVFLKGQKSGRNPLCRHHDPDVHESTEAFALCNRES